jgi:hypothetical protein
MSASLAERRWRLAVRMNAAAAVWSLGLLLAAVLVPAEGEQTVSSGEATLTQQTLVQSSGASALLLVAVPLIASVVVAVAMVHRRREDPAWALPAAWSAVGVLAVVALLGITSVGAFMVPAAILLSLSVRLAPGRGDVRARPVPRNAEGGGDAGDLATGS